MVFVGGITLMRLRFSGRGDYSFPHSSCVSPAVSSQFFGAMLWPVSDRATTGRGRETGPSFPQVIEKIRPAVFGIKSH